MYQDLHNNYTSSLYSIKLSQIEIPNDVWWRKHYFPSSNQQLIEEINQFKKSISNIIVDDFYSDFSNFYRYKFVQECLVEEGNISSTNFSTFELVDYIEETVSKIGDNNVCPLDKASIKIINLYQASLEIFPQILFTQLEMENFTPEFAKNLHKIVCKDLLINNGEYRKSYASPSQEDFEYLYPEYIEDAMDCLFTRIRKLCHSQSSDIESIIKISSIFLSNFLFIHPFSNGNGRVARLLTSFVLSSVSAVPVSLLIQSDTGENKCPTSRSTYSDCLREAQKTIPLKPDALTTFILESVHNTLRNTCFALDISLNND